MPAHDAVADYLPRLTPAAFRDRARETHRGSPEANTLHSAERHFKHRASILGGFPIRTLKPTGLQGAKAMRSRDDAGLLTVSF